MNKLLSILCVCFLAGFSSLQAAEALPTRPPRLHGVQNSGGGRQASSSYQHVSAIGGTGGEAASFSLHTANFSGPVRSHAWGPTLDSDSDGLLDAFELDNDNDGLSDVHEVRGDLASGRGATASTIADTDGDGLGDGQEALAGTDPLDVASQVRITELTIDATGKVLVRWIGLSNWTYSVQPMHVVTGSGTHSKSTKFAPTQRAPAALGAVTYTFEDSPVAADGRFYRVEIEEK